MKNILEVCNVKYSYNNSNILKNINFTLEQGDILALLGPNGSGKTTLLKILLGLYRTSGEIFLYKKNLTKYTQKEIAQLISYVPQTHKITFSYTVFEIILMGRLPYVGFFSSFTKKDFSIAEESMEKIGISHLKKCIYSNLSGGEQQLVLIARSLAQEAKILFMDEPVNGLDYGNQLRLLNLLKELSTMGYTFLKTTHYPDHVFYCSNKVVMLKSGEIVAFNSVNKALVPSNIKTLYGIDVNINKTETGHCFCIPNM